MHASTAADRRHFESLDPVALERRQLASLNRLLDAILPANEFYAERWSEIPRPLTSLEQLAQAPYTHKEDLLAGKRLAPGKADWYASEFSANLTFPLDQYTRFHRTSGTRGRPLVVLDTPEDWAWWIEGWQYVFDAAEVTSRDHVLLAFSFGPFIGFWTAHDAAQARGCLVVPGGGMNTLARLELIRASRATVVCCTPSYALHMAEVASQRQIDLPALEVRSLILAGEPGGSQPSTRERIEGLWGARVTDHAGATEVGPWGYSDRERLGLRVLESEFIAEFLSVQTGGPAGEGELSELVLTSLGRVGAPVIRYRTGDLVRPTWRHSNDNRFVLLEGGVLARADDMLIIRGVNVFPGAVEQILRSFPEVVEFRMTARKVHEMDQLSIEIEDRLDQPERVAEELRLRLGLKVDVTTAPIGALPRFEAKGARFIDERPKAP